MKMSIRIPREDGRGIGRDGGHVYARGHNS